MSTRKQRERRRLERIAYEQARHNDKVNAEKKEKVSNKTSEKKTKKKGSKK
jgi:hypothetical protein